MKKVYFSHFSYNFLPTFTFFNIYTAKILITIVEDFFYRDRCMIFFTFGLNYIRSIPRILNNRITEQFNFSLNINIFISSISKPWTTGRTQRGFIHWRCQRRHDTFFISFFYKIVVQIHFIGTQKFSSNIFFLFTFYHYEMHCLAK